MFQIPKLKELSFLVYGLGISGRSVISFFKKNNHKNFKVWDDINNKIHQKLRPKNLNQALKEVDYICGNSRSTTYTHNVCTSW